MYINSDAKNAGTGEDVDEFVYHAVLYFLTLSVPTCTFMPSQFQYQLPSSWSVL